MPTFFPSSPTPINPTQSQSWSSYILSTYASSVSPTTDPDQYAPTATPVSPRNMSTTTTTTPSFSASTTTSSSPWGPYLKSGRGGAGNFTWQSSLSPSASQPPDLESAPPHPTTNASTLPARQQAAAEAEALEQADALAARREREQRSQEDLYTHLGRGGAGNYTTASASDVPSPPELPPAGSLAPQQQQQDSPSTTAGNRVDPLLAARSGYFGRGGAGNYNADAKVVEAEKEKVVREELRKERRRAEEEVRRQVVESVELEMRRPEGVVVRAGKY